MRFDVDSAFRAHERRRDTEAREAAVRSLVNTDLEAVLLTAMITDQRFEAHAPLCMSAIDYEPLDENFVGPRCTYPLHATTLQRCTDMVRKDEVELDDFTDYRHRAILQALRNLQHRGVTGEWRGFENAWIALIDEEIIRCDRSHADRHLHEKVNAAFMAELVLRQPSMTCVGIDTAKRRLRELANLRRLV